MIFVTYNEPHSADGATLIRRDDLHRWSVWVRGVWVVTWFRRRDAREDIRRRKATQ